MKNNIHILGVIIAIYLIGTLLTTHVMSAHSPIDSKKIRTNGYFEQFGINSNKTPIYDKNGNVFGYTEKSHQDGQEVIVYDLNDNVKGYLQQDLFDSSKLRFFKENNY